MVHFLNPLHCLTVKSVCLLLDSSSVLSTHTAGFVIEYLSSVAFLSDCCCPNNYGDRTALTETSGQDVFHPWYYKLDSFCVNLCVQLCRNLLHDNMMNAL